MHFPATKRKKENTKPIVVGNKNMIKEKKSKLKFGTIVAIEDDLFKFCDLVLVNEEVERILEKFNAKIEDSDLDGWTISITIVYKRATAIYFSKKGVNYPSVKEKEFYLRVPVPTSIQSPYGFNKNKFEYDDPSEAGFIKLVADFQGSNSLEDFFTKSIHGALEAAFSKGLTVNGKKIKIVS